MTDVNFSKLRVLVADDFSNFRSTVNAMLSNLGIYSVDAATSGEDAIERCQKQYYDVVLCDYDLGRGKNGQQVLEELRFRQLIPRRSVFIMVSADATKEAVMAAYDCEPDDYLMKPINARMLQQRMARLLQQRQLFAPVYGALEAEQSGRALPFLVDVSISNNRHALAAQKMLGELFIAQGEYGKAEKLYTKALEVRTTDWARVGMARVRHLQGELEIAGEWLEKILLENPLYLPAYDVLASNWEKLGQLRQVQATVQRSVAISPKSILRQKRLADVARRNGDEATALDALRVAVKLGELSCHAAAEDHFDFARVAGTHIEKSPERAEPLAREAVQVVDSARQRFVLTPEQQASADLLSGQVLSLSGKVVLGRELIERGSVGERHRLPLSVQIDMVTAWRAAGDQERADLLLNELLQTYADDQAALEQLDRLLAEPASESNRAMIAEVNREGIELYNREQFDAAITCFEQVRRMFPRHVGVHLNIVQALIGKLRSGQRDAETQAQTQAQTQAALTAVGGLLEPGDSQYARYQRLRQMALASMAN